MSTSATVSISVVISAYNYAHFLPACLDSLRAQTEGADEIVVVNDGSTDATADILAAEQGIKVINQENRGQAAAFNVGVAETSGDAILFLDADDRLKPTALETLRRFWSEEVSCLCFDLEMVDRDGAAVGRYDMRVPQVDLLPRLLRDLAMPFMPTSGNLFRRDAVAWAFPLPEPRWKISADAVLIRLAAFAGPILHVPHTLGEYRVHRHNNWFKEFAAQNWRLQRGHTDIAQTGIELIELADRAKQPLNPSGRLMLLFAMLKAQVKADELGEDDKGLTPALRTAIAVWPKTERAAVRALFYGLLVALPRSAILRSWVIDRSARPRVLDGMLSRVIGKDLAAQMEHAALPRAPFSHKWDSASNMERPRLDAHFATRAWVRRWTGDWFDLCDDVGEIVFTRSTADAVDLKMDVEPPGSGGVVLSVSQGGVLLEQFHIHHRQTVSVQLLATDCIAAASDRIELRVEQPSYLKSRWSDRIKRPAQRLRLHGFTLDAPTRQAPGAVLPISEMRDFGSLLSSISDAPLEDIDALHPDAPLVLARPPVSPPLSLMLELDQTQPPGWVTVSLDGQVAYVGHVGANAMIRAQVPEAAVAPGATLHLHTGFEPDDATHPAQLMIDRMGWDHAAAQTDDGVVRLGMGQRLGPHFDLDAQAMLTEGWHISDDGPPVFHASSAEIIVAFDCLDHAGGVILELDVALTVERSEIDAPALLVSVNGQQREALRLGGRHVVGVALDAETARGSCILGLHAAIISAQDAPPLPHGGIELHGIGLADPAKDQHQITPPRRAYIPSAPRKPMLAQLQDAGFVVPDDLVAFRADLMAEINGITGRALADYLTPPVLDYLARLGADADLCLPATLASGHGADWLRWFGVAMLSGPGWKVAPELGLSDLPALDHAYAAQVGAWMGSPPSQKDAALYVAPMMQRLAEVKRAVISTHETSQSVAASALLGAVNIAHSKELAQPFAAAIEAKLLAEGQTLRLVAPPTNGGVGVLLRDADSLTPDLLDMLTDMARRKAVTVFSAAPLSGLPDTLRHVDLTGLPYTLAVSDMRRRALDTVLVASPLDRYDFTTLVAAHQLARQQIDLARRTPFASTALPAPRYLFHHMPKAAGTSLRNMMEDWFDVTPDYREWWGDTAPAPLDLTRISSIGMLFGHFETDNMPLDARYPETADPAMWRRITFVRDPLEQAISWHGFEKVARPKHDPSFKPVPLDRYLQDCGSVYLRHFSCDTSNWRAALDRYWFIGTQERFDASVACLAHALQRPAPEILQYHRTPSKDVPSAKAVTAFRQRMAVDFEIYHEIDARLTARIKAP